MDNNNRQNPKEQELEQPEVEKGISPVANLPAKNMAVIGVFVVVIVVMIYMLFFSGSNDENNVDKPKLEQKTEAVKPAEPELPMPNIAQAPIEPKIETPVIAAPVVTIAPPPPPPAPEPTPIEPTAFVPSATVMSEDSEALKQRKKSSIMILGSETAGNTAVGKALDQERVNSMVINPYFEPTKTTAEQVKATRIGDLSATVAQGKIIDAILETAINTDFPGYVRAIVSRDVYGEAGNAVLIPKGSRLIGAYSAEIKRTQKRVMIVWNRVIRPDGIDVMLDSPGVDQIGRAGSEGFVDTKFFEIFSNALLMSVVNFTITYQAEALKNRQVGKNKYLGENYNGQNTAGTTGLTQQQISTLNNTFSASESAALQAVLAALASGQSTTTTVNPQTGATTTTSSSGAKNNIDKAFEDASKTMNDAMKNIATGLLDERPTITLDQGTRIKVFVKKDLVFPAQYSGSTRVIK